MLQAIARSPRYKWWVFCTIGIGIFFSVVDHGSVLVALPEIESHFGSDLPTVQWVVVGYALAISVLLLPVGKLADTVGRKRVYVAGLVVYLVSAIVSGFAVNMTMLITARVFQGIGSAMIQGIAMAMIISAFPSNERGKALGSNMSVVGSGAIAGPALGGFLVSVLGWRWVFFVNVPFGIITILASILILERGQSAAETTDDKNSGFDWLGAVLSGAVLLIFLLVVSNGDRFGWTSYLVVGGAFSFVALAVAFVWWELRVAVPMLELRLFTRKLVAMGVAAGWLSFFGGSALRFIAPFYLQRLLGLSPGQVGLLMIPAAVCMIVVGPISGRLSDKFGWRGLTMSGMALSAIAAFTLASTLAENSPALLIVAMLMLQSTGIGLFNSPNNSSIFSAVEPSSYGVVSALTQLVRNSANVLGVALTTTVVVTVMGLRGAEPSLDAVSPQIADAFVAGLRVAFLMLGGFTTLGLVITFLRGERAKPVPAPATQPSASGALSD
ncbi:MAG: MFS transporter [Chloroflexi bacterium]|nr:MFS transporter [Chloroflexota bacterium]MDA1218608.1 MFS transporter [Chloroflexota bacterium]